LIEVPHGATDAADYHALAAQMRGALPDDLVEFFHANTDEGAPEIASAIAYAFTAMCPDRSAQVIRCHIPRTLIDCNRRVDLDPAAFREGGVTPGVPPWITLPDDLAVLREQYRRYQSLVQDARSALSSEAGVILLHTYAPRTVDVQVDLDIVSNMKAAWSPEVAATWPLRPEVETITEDFEGRSWAPEGVMEPLKASLASVGLHVGDSTTYKLHPSTMAWDHVQARPQRTLCIEVRRDLVCAPWRPFEGSATDDDGVFRVAGPIAFAVATGWFEFTPDGPAL
jgi:predicted N-formylglutamate amidohydrolase